MSFLSLNNIGKIYVNEGNVSVGIRGVNLDFDLGEFVAITGESGSGKSTLLNVISGIDTYEEGEMYIEGEPTSHYIQSDFEEYRKEYISFIFQDYNIIESYTVLENVELALMHIDNQKQRRAKALELIERVGLTPWIKHRGSKLSGGQKQRTVIARALAKDSPIILADEPTGNLDASTSREIIELLKEVSNGKLLIVVTHNFEEVADFATRHIRVYNSKVISDYVISQNEKTEFENKATEKKDDIKTPLKNSFRVIKNGITLGRSIFKSTPILSFFTVFLMFVCTMGLIIVTSFFSDAFNLFPEYKLFNEIDGRVVFIPRDEIVLSEEEIEQIGEKYGAEDFIKYDAILDYKLDVYYKEIEHTVGFTFEYYNNDMEPQYGRKPKTIDEIMLYAPLGLKDVYGELQQEKTIMLNQLQYKVVGISYFYDNTKTGKIISTKEGFEFLSYLFYFDSSDAIINVNIVKNDVNMSQTYKNFIIDFSLNGEVLVVPNLGFSEEDFLNVTAYMQFFLMNSLNNNAYVYIPLTAYEELTRDKIRVSSDNTLSCPVMSKEMFKRIIEENALKDYSQASLFFENSQEARNAIDIMNNEGYVAVGSSSTYTPDALTVIIASIVTFFNSLMWLAVVFFLSFFVGLCLSRSIGSFKSDLPIMRSMGIPVKVIKIGVYTKILMSQILAFIPAGIIAFVVFTTPKYNLLFTFLSPVHYTLIFLGVIIMSVRVTQKQIRKLFDTSVKAALKGGKDQ